MAANPFTRGTCPGRARPPHRASFAMGHAKHGGRKKGTLNAISPRARKAIAAATKRLARSILLNRHHLNRHHWQRLIDNNPLIIEACEHQGKFTLDDVPRFRSRQFKMKSFCKDLSAVAMRAIRTDQFVDRDLEGCLTHLSARDPSEFAKFIAVALPKQSYLAARPHAEVLEPRDAVNPGEYRRPPIPEWTRGYDRTLNAYTPMPVDQALTPQDAYHEVCGAPFDPAPGWDWKVDSEINLFRAIALRPKTPIPEWTQRCDPTNVYPIPVPVDPRLTPDQAHHPEYGSPLDPAPGWTWVFNSRTERLLPSIMDEPNRSCQPKYTTPQRRLYRWHPDQGHYSLVREDDDDGEAYDDNLYEYDTERLFFKRYRPPLEPLTSTHPLHQKRFPVRRPDGSLVDIYEFDANKDQFVRVTK
jgi:hypothetical protein